ncbi:MAG: heavy metal translocating P-type ATPase [Lachnospiraceae bacterium]|nr:heavy metal translocating P-type ATPase [Lachnospiraceae bacterium]
MTKYNITGMSCAACSARVEKAVGAVAGVDSVSVSLLTNSMMVEGDASTDEVIRAVKAAGYGADSVVEAKELEVMDSFSPETMEQDNMDEPLEDRETPSLRRRLIASLVILIPLMYIAMGHTMWDWPLPEILTENIMAQSLLQFILCSVVLVLNKKFFINGVRGVLHRAPNMDTLVALGSGVSYIYSVYGMFAISHFVTKGNTTVAMEYHHNLYFESAAMILALITLGKLLEAYSKGKTTDAIKSLIRLTPKVATVVRDGVEVEIPIEQVKVGDTFIVRPGENVPVDGMVIEGNSAVDESALTGESIPVDKEKGSLVSAATINQSGYLKCMATRVGKDTALAQIIKLVSDASATKAPIAKVADKVSGVFVPIVIGVALITTIIWLGVGAEISFALARGISVLVISCPCALGLATPVAIMVGNGVGARKGILFKTAASLEETGRVQVVALDKTGTITLGKPQVTNLVTAEGVNEDELLKLALSLEVKSEHPLAKAVVEYCKGISEAGDQLEPLAVSDFVSIPGNGLTAIYEEVELAGGNYQFIGSKVNIPEELMGIAHELSDEGKTPLYFSCGDNVLGLIAVADVVKNDSVEAVKQLKSMGIRVVMLTGDNEITAQAIGKQVGVDQIIAEVLPNGKEATIRELMENTQGKVVMVGDGINDAPALTRADIGIAIGAGTDIAIEAADVVLMKNSIMDVATAIRLSRKVLRNIKENLFWAFIYNIIGIPVAAGALYYATGLLLNPMIGALAMSLSSFCVVSNALRLNLFKVDKAENKRESVIEYQQIEEAQTDKALDTYEDLTEADIETEAVVEMEECVEIEEKGEEIAMITEKTMKIEGMMCGHCEARVKKTLEELAQVEEAIVSHEKGEAVVRLSGDISDDELTKVVEAQNYKVVSMK